MDSESRVARAMTSGRSLQYRLSRQAWRIRWARLAIAAQPLPQVVVGVEAGAERPSKRGSAIIVVTPLGAPKSVFE